VQETFLSSARAREECFYVKSRILQPMCNFFNLVLLKNNFHEYTPEETYSISGPKHRVSTILAPRCIEGRHGWWRPMDPVGSEGHAMLA
jgi:hypothetical protein